MYLYSFALKQKEKCRVLYAIIALVQPTSDQIALHVALELKRVYQPLTEGLGNLCWCLELIS